MRLAQVLFRAGRTTPTKPVHEVFDIWAVDGRDAQMEHAHGPVARRLFAQLRLAPDAWFLDIGCGNGFAVRWAADTAPRGRAVGIDASEEMVCRARMLSSSFPRAEFRRALFPEHDLPAASFDVVFSVEAFYYLEDLRAGLGEVLTLLKPGGVFVMAVDFFQENRDSHGWPGYVGTRMKLLSQRGWRRAFERAGFASVCQNRVVIPPEDAVETWHTTVGSLVTSGRRPH